MHDLQQVCMWERTTTEVSEHAVNMAAAASAIVVQNYPLTRVVGLF